MKASTIQPVNEEVSFFALLSILVRFKKWVLGVPLITSIVAVVVVFLQPNYYTAELKISSMESDTLLNSTVNTPQIVDQLEQRLKLMAYYQEPSLERLSIRLSKATKVVEKNKSKLLLVTVTDKDPKMAAAIANAYGEAIIDTANTQYLVGKGKSKRKSLKQLEKELAGIRVLSTKNDEQIEIHGVEKTLRQLTSTARFAIDYLGSLRAEAATLNDMDKLAQPDILQLSQIMLTANQLIKSYLTNNASHDETLYEALTLQQQKAFLRGVEESLSRKINIVKDQLAQDHRIIVKASVPPIKSGPPRLAIIITMGFVSLFLTILAVLILASFVKMKREYLHSQQT